METVIRDLKKSYNNTTALDIADFRICDAGVIGLAGNNGAGKTTLFRLMLDLIKADCGSVQINGIDVARSEAWKEKVGAYLDDSFLIDYLTPEEYSISSARFAASTNRLSMSELHGSLIS